MTKYLNEKGGKKITGAVYQLRCRNQLRFNSNHVLWKINHRQIKRNNYFSRCWLNINRAHFENERLRLTLRPCCHYLPLHFSRKIYILLMGTLCGSKDILAGPYNFKGLFEGIYSWDLGLSEVSWNGYVRVIGWVMCYDIKVLTMTMMKYGDVCVCARVCVCSNETLQGAAM